MGAHCLMFGSTRRSYRELPLRIADFGVLHRNEQSGALTGLTRVRRFVQDDGHIFCAEEQIKEEVTGCLEFMKYVYDTFGMSYRLELSTRPKKALGEQALWDRAEAALAASMDDFAGKGNWKENPGDGAFYGPKIDLKVMDAMDRAVERMFAVLLEHYGGKWPFWLSPRQALVVPVGMKYVPYARDVRDRLKAAGFHADADDSTNSLKKK